MKNRNKSEKIGINQKKSDLEPGKSEKIRKIGKIRKNQKKSEKVGINQKKSVFQTMETNGFHWIQAIPIDSGKIGKNRKKSEKIGKNRKKSVFHGDQ